MLHSARRVSLSESVRDQLARLILSGVFPPGAQLPSERELCSRMNVGRTSLREALRALQALGLIEVRSGKGTYVPANLKQAVPYAAWPGAFQCTPRDVLELRLAVETRAAAMAAARGTSADFAAIADTLAAFVHAMQQQDLPAMVWADLGFHQSIMEAAGNSLMVEVMNRIAPLRLESLRISLSRSGHPLEVLEWHRSILAAIQQRDAEGAARAMQDHLQDWADKFGLERR